MNDNNELLTWAVQNITEWGTVNGETNDDYTHLRSDDSHNPVFYTSGSGWIIQPGEFWFGESLCDNHEELEVEDFSTKTPQVITKQEWMNAFHKTRLHTKPKAPDVGGDPTAQDGSQSQGEALQGLNEVQVGHIHANLMTEYAEVAKTNPEPWREFEYFEEYDQIWQELDEDSSFHSSTEYRRKPSPPKTMNIGGIVVEAWPLESIKNYGDEYFEVTQHFGEFLVTSPAPWVLAEEAFKNRVLRAGYIFSTEEQAQVVADALNKVYNDALVGWKAE